MDRWEGSAPTAIRHRVDPRAHGSVISRIFEPPPEKGGSGVALFSIIIIVQSLDPLWNLRYGATSEPPRGLSKPGKGITSPPARPTTTRTQTSHPSIYPAIYLSCLVDKFARPYGCHVTEHRGFSRSVFAVVGLDLNLEHEQKVTEKYCCLTLTKR